MIYLDHAATTPLRPEARAVLAAALEPDAVHANPAAAHAAGREQAGRVARARADFAALIGADPAEIVFTSGATEADNLAVLGRARFAQEQGRRLLLPRTEHKAVIDPVRHLAGQGWRVDWLDPGPAGVVDAQAFADACGADTVLACAMQVNNETGHIQDVAAIGAALAGRGVPLHVDAAQALGKVPVRVGEGIGSMAFSGHKFGAPVGVGALYLRSRPRVGIEPLQFGGGQERGLRSGTLAVPMIEAFVAAAKAAEAARQAEQQRLGTIREALWQRLSAQLPDLIRNGAAAATSAHVLSVSVPGVQGEALRASLPALAASSGSACSAAQAESSYVLRALGHDDAQADASLRLSFGHTTTARDIDEAAAMLLAAVQRLRAMHPEAA